MEINAAGFSAKELVANRASVEQDLTQKAREKDENEPQTARLLEPKPIDQPNGDKLGRIDIYA